jgi:imidazolonepropionase-like amidohydrolase
MNKKIITLFLGVFTLSQVVVSQTTFPVNGVKESNPVFYYFKNATIHLDYATTIENGVLVIKDGKVFAVGKDLQKPKGAIEVDLKDKHIYPSFIDPNTDYGMPKITNEKKGRNEQFLSEKKGAYGWNEAVKPEIDAAKLFTYNEKQAKSFINNGFGAVLTHQKDGIVRGTSTAVLLSENDNKAMLTGYAASHFSFRKGSSTQNYPGSLMGCIALIRQTYLDAEWYANQKTIEEYNLTLEAFNNNLSLPQIFDVDDYQSAIRADKIGDEFGFQYIIAGSGDEYKRINEIVQTNAAFIIPVNYPKVYDVEDPFDALLVSTEDMKHWELAPLNPKILHDNGVLFAFTSAGLEDISVFLKNVKKTISYGLPKDIALKALTYNPAMLLGAQDVIGSLHPDKIANFIITSGDIFENDTKLFENWIAGKKHVIDDMNQIDIRGKYNLTVNGEKFELIVEGDINKTKAHLKIDTVKTPVQISNDNTLIHLSFELKNNVFDGLVSLSGKINNKGSVWDGKGQLNNGEWIDWSAIKSEPFKEDDKKKKSTEKDTLMGVVQYPNMAFGHKGIPSTNNYLIKNATVWTCELEGILNETDVLIKNGKIAAIGKNISAEGIEIIDAKGKHLTPGIIDEHSHIAISKGVNECTQNNTAEVSIADVVNADDINIYRQLAGGVTAAQLLHGSCNPIGGQSALIKLRWGQSAEKMKIENADGFIKFALGENVKRSNFGGGFNSRFPQSRMGVEQVYYDAFTRAKEYQLQWATYSMATSLAKKKDKSKINPPRRDLELDIVSEIMNSKRFISCHSYVQTEINMLMHVADSMGFKVNTFTHILEGYKLAPEMKAHGAGGSTFSDWWAYKFEVNDAIPYNGALMSSQGITTAFNSDDAEMGRRLNQEAGKAVKYGGVSEEEALKFVTLNPAKLLHLDNRMGSVKVGKDADLVLWTDHPLSIYAKATTTFVDGIIYYDILKNDQLIQENNIERRRLINKMIQATKNGEPKQKKASKEQTIYHCESADEEI